MRVTVTIPLGTGPPPWDPSEGEEPREWGLPNSKRDLIRAVSQRGQFENDSDWRGTQLCERGL